MYRQPGLHKCQGLVETPLAALLPMLAAEVLMGCFPHHRVKYEKRANGGKNHETTGDFFPSTLEFILIRKKANMVTSPGCAVTRMS